MLNVVLFMNTNNDNSIPKSLADVFFKVEFQSTESPMKIITTRAAAKGDLIKQLPFLIYI